MIFEFPAPLLHGRFLLLQLPGQFGKLRAQGVRIDASQLLSEYLTAGLHIFNAVLQVFQERAIHFKLPVKIGYRAVTRIPFHLPALHGLFRLIQRVICLVTVATGPLQLWFKGPGVIRQGT